MASGRTVRTAHETDTMVQDTPSTTKPPHSKSRLTHCNQNSGVSPLSSGEYRLRLGRVIPEISPAWWLPGQNHSACLAYAGREVRGYLSDPSTDFKAFERYPDLGPNNAKEGPTVMQTSWIGGHYRYARLTSWRCSVVINDG